MDTLVQGVTYYVANADSGAGGFYHGDTRHLTPTTVTLADEPLPMFDERFDLPVARTRRHARTGTPINEITEENAHEWPSVVLTRTERLSEGRMRETVHLDTHGARIDSATLTVSFDADFADIFEVRGHQDMTDRDVTADVGDRAVTYRYAYEDANGRTRRLDTTVRFDREPAELEPGRATFEPSLSARDSWQVTFDVVPGGDESTVRAPAQADGSQATNGVAGELAHVDPFAVDDSVTTGDRCIDEIFAQARRDVQSLTTMTEHGPVPLAGAPWFVTVFGRDAAIAAYFLAPFAPDLASGTLKYLAAHQGSEADAATDERAGKIFHEIRRGELARTAQIPHTPYFGAVDATSLWVVLLHETWRWSEDDALVRECWSNLEAALEWLDRETKEVGDDPFLYYRDLGSVGVSHREWRDSADGVQFADGSHATPPLASAAVQGYTYDALVRAAELAETVADEPDQAAAFRERASQLERAFDDAFWMSERSFYATALTADGVQVDSITSNVGHCLWSGIVPAHRTEEVAAVLRSPEVFSEYGIRTLSAAETGYNPLSYHAGSVWPHDNALAALGLASAGHIQDARAVSRAQFSAFTAFDGNSIPELFCGFDDSSGPVPYAAACRPQAWAAAAPYGFLRAVLALDPDRPRESLRSDPESGFTADAVASFLDHWS